MQTLKLANFLIMIFNARYDYNQLNGGLSVQLISSPLPRSSSQSWCTFPLAAGIFTAESLQPSVSGSCLGGAHSRWTADAEIRRPPSHAPIGNTSTRLSTFRVSCRIFRDLNCSSSMIQLLSDFSLSKQMIHPRVCPSKVSAWNFWFQSLFPGKSV